MRGPTFEELQADIRLRWLCERIYQPVDTTVVRAFIDSYICPAPGQWLSAAELHTALAEYCRASGAKLASQQLLGRELRRKYEWIKKGRIIYLDIAFCEKFHNR